MGKIASLIFFTLLVNAMNKHSYPATAMFFLLLFLNISRSFEQTTPAQNVINVVVNGLDHETTDFTLLRQNLETMLKVKIYSSFSYNMSTLDFMCNKTPSEIWDKLPQDTKDRFKLIRIEPLRIQLTTKETGKDSVTNNSSARTNDKEAIKEVVESFGDALLNNNENVAASLLTADFVCNVYGKRMNKEERLSSINSGQYKYGPFKKEDVKITLYGNTATVIITTDVKYKSGDNDVSVNFSSLTFIKKEENWQLSGECLMGNGCFK